MSLTNIIAETRQENKNSFPKEPLLPIAYGRIIEPLTAYRVNGGKYQVSKYRLILIKCPFCRREHIHKYPHEPLPHLKNIKTRTSHCIWGRGYEIIESEVGK